MVDGAEDVSAAEFIYGTPARIRSPNFEIDQATGSTGVAAHPRHPSPKPTRRSVATAITPDHFHRPVALTVDVTPSVGSDTSSASADAQVGSAPAPDAVTQAESSATDGWAALNNLSSSTLRVVANMGWAGLFMAVLGVLSSFAYTVRAGRCADGESYVLIAEHRTDVNPNFGRKWTSLFSSNVVRDCIPSPTCRADKFLFHMARGNTPHLTAQSVENAAVLVKSKLVTSKHPACVQYADTGLSPAQAQACFRAADRDGGDQMSKHEFVVWFACMKIPPVCHNFLCA